MNEFMRSCFKPLLRHHRRQKQKHPLEIQPYYTDWNKAIISSLIPLFIRFYFSVLSQQKKTKLKARLTCKWNVEWFFHFWSIDKSNKNENLSSIPDYGCLCSFFLTGRKKTKTQKEKEQKKRLKLNPKSNNKE